MSAAAPRAVLRDPRAADAQAMFAYRTDPQVTRYQTWIPASVDELQAMIAAQARSAPYAPGAWHQLAIEAAETGALAGDCGIRRDVEDPRQAVFGISLATAHHGRGYATDAVRALLEIAFGSLALHRVTLSVDPRNVRSIALAERTGFRREAHHRESLWTGGEWLDDVIYAMLRREWDSRRAPQPEVSPGS